MIYSRFQPALSFDSHSLLRVGESHWMSQWTGIVIKRRVPYIESFSSVDSPVN
ncbi:hypothetical protein H1P_2330007 [Hyella patelloides LEGE 07179]|uniref:Uncharacterized protein n=1 Tax=Hyella patelloides LEGE 07179 TaxID=945734 RepID=A0A563VRI2_9CYAN|nr:hypothetical protein H1P_2330007 [Hyella patelloides LEGE 07179]